ncbi:MAG: rod shape-determining protein MreD [Coriobacteriales bacterium]|jgi:rod shape-determining protein MreD|nr:rod shape-determining protein MreD [Coriobacteriales bacterium]
METAQQPPVGVVIVSAVIALVLQLVLAPVITLFGVVPNFVLVVVIITAMHNGPVRSLVMGFALGLVLDFCSLGPLGALALVLTILAYAVSSLNKGVFTGGIVVDMIILLAALIAGEFLISVIYAIVGANPEFLLSLVQRVLPAIAYDAIIGLILMLIYNAVVGDTSFRSGGGTGRSLTRKLHL